MNLSYSYWTPGIILLYVPAFKWLFPYCLVKMNPAGPNRIELEKHIVQHACVALTNCSGKLVCHCLNCGKKPCFCTVH